MHDPGIALAYVQLKPDQSIDDAQQILVKTIEGLAIDPPSQEEVDRAKGRILKNIELAFTNSQTMAISSAAMPAMATGATSSLPAMRLVK